MTKRQECGVLGAVLALLSSGSVGVAYGVEETFYYPAQEAALITFTYRAQRDSLLIEFAEPAGRIAGVEFSASGLAIAAQYVCEQCSRIDREDCFTFPYESNYVLYVELEIAGELWRGGWAFEQDGTFAIDHEALRLAIPGDLPYVATSAVVRCFVVDFGTEDRCVGSGVHPLSRTGGEFVFDDDIEIVVIYDAAVPAEGNSWGGAKARFRQ